MQDGSYLEFSSALTSEKMNAQVCNNNYILYTNLSGR